MRGYGQFCPVAKAAEIFAERWTPLVLRELLCGSRRFNDLHRGVPMMSRTLLRQRLDELERDGVVERRPKPAGRGWEYCLTPAGEEFRPIVEGLGEWGQRWAHRQVERDDDLDPGLLMWDIHRRLVVETLPHERLLIEFEFRRVPGRGGQGKRTWWLLVRRPEVELCLKDPGFEVDLVVDADLRALTRVWLGDIRFEDARRAGLITLEGPRQLVQAFPSWLGLSVFARVERPLLAAG